MRIGVDLGGTKIEIVALGDAGDELVRRRVPSPAHSYEAIVETIGELVDDLERELGARGSVGVGTPGSLSPTRAVMRNANSTVLIGRPLPQDLTRRLRREVRVANDADCFTLSESVDGAGAGVRSCFGIIAGTGVGGGLTIEGRLVGGRNGIAGEWGHMPLPWPSDDDVGEPCYCGRRGCVETFLSGPAFALDDARRRKRRLEPVEIVALAQAGDAIALDSLARYVDRFARALAVVIDVLDPEVVVLGGGMSNVPALGRRVAAALGPYVFSDAVETTVVPALHGDSSGVRGAAWLWPAPQR